MCLYMLVGIMLFQVHYIIEYQVYGIRPKGLHRKLSLYSLYMHSYNDTIACIAMYSVCGYKSCKND